MEGGAFLYRPFIMGDGSKHYSAFARVEARSENGYHEPGRKFTHCAVLIVEERWEPKLVPWVARMLFDNDLTDEFGIPWGAPIPELHDTRQERKLPPLSRADLGAYREEIDVAEWPFKNGPGGTLVTRARIPKDIGEKLPQVRLANVLATQLREFDLSTHGRWLSFAIGVSRTADAPGPGFAFRMDDRPSENDLESITVHFSDSTPPDVNTAALQAAANLSLSHTETYGVNWARLRPATAQAPGRTAVRFTPVFGENQLWPDQIPGGLAERIVQDGWTNSSGAAAFDTRANQPVQYSSEPQSTSTKDQNLTYGEAPPGRSRTDGTSEPQINVENWSNELRSRQQVIGASAEPDYATMPLPQPEEDMLNPTLDNTLLADPLAQPVPAKADEYVSTKADYKINWPTLPDQSVEWVREPELLDQLRRRFEALTALLNVLDNDEFSRFALFGSQCDQKQDNEAAIELFAEAFANVAIIACIYATVGQPRDLAEPLSALMAHGPIDRLGLPAATKGSFHIHVFDSILQHWVGLDALILFIKRRARVARDMAKLTNMGGQIIIAPEPRDFRALLTDIVGSRPLPEELEQSLIWAEATRVSRRIAGLAADMIKEVIVEPSTPL